MTLKKLKEKKSEIKKLISEEHYSQACELTIVLIQQLFTDKQYSKIVEIYKSELCGAVEDYYIFEVAFSLSKEGYVSDAENIYESMLAENPKNSSALNNLHLIKLKKGKIDDAFELIDKAYKISPDDTIILRNYNQLLSEIREKEDIENKYRNALPRLHYENDYVISKLKYFISNFSKDSEHTNGILAIPRWKFKVLIGVDEQRANSLRNQWLDRDYIRDIGNRNEYNVIIYELNPYLKKELAKVVKLKVNPKWISGFELVDVENLQKYGYFDIIKKIERIKKKYKTIIKRDFDELYFNYLMGNYKAVIVLSGSLIEALLIYHCEKKGIRQIEYQKKKNVVKRNLFDCNLGDLLSFFEEDKTLGNIVVHLGNLSRINRNFVHPGKELRDTEILNQTKSNLCFSSAIEIITKILRVK